MQTKETRIFNGMYGRARKAHRQNRVSRFHQDEMVTEYFDDPEEGFKPQRLIPIRHKSEFLPSAHYVDQNSLQAAQPVELLLQSKQRKFMNKSKSKLIPHHQAIKFTKTQKAKSAVTSFRSRKLKDAKAWQPVHLSPRIFTGRSPWRRWVASLSLGGFAYGCLLGGAVAAFMLMLIDIMMTRTL